MLAHARSLTSQLHSLRQELGEIDSQTGGLGAARGELAAAEQAEKEISSSLAVAAKDQEILQRLGPSAASAAVKGDVFRRSLNVLQQFKARTESVLTPLPQIEPWPPTAGSEDLLTSARRLLAESIQQVRQSVTRLGEALKEVTRLEQENARHRLEIEEESRHVRRSLEQRKQGARSSRAPDGRTAGESCAIECSRLAKSGKGTPDCPIDRRTRKTS